MNSLLSPNLLAWPIRGWASFLFLFLFSVKTTGQPAGLPWQLDPACQSIITNGIAAVTCGTTEEVPQAERFTFGMMNLNGALPVNGRVDVTNQVQMYHHPSWHIDDLGNVFGITMDGCGNTYLAASSNYGADFFGHIAIIKYGNIGGGANSLQAAGTVYKIDAFTGQASVFAVLPQLSATFTQTSCEGGTEYPRTTGPGLGNIVYSRFNKQFYVSDFEDGRIYRLDENGAILDSYDPLVLDNGAAGTPPITELVYGLDIDPAGAKLYFGTGGVNGFIDPPVFPRIFAIDLNPDGSFIGTINNTTLPAGANWDNYIGTQTLHFQLTSTNAFTDVLSFSDLEFTPSGKLLVGCRIGCFENIHSSYNHGGESLVLSQNISGLYNTLVGNVLTGYPFSIGNSNEGYGGVSVFHDPVGTDIFAFSSGDILAEEGPHGICIVPEGVFGTPGMPANPAGAISYGFVDDDFMDPKGVGGDVKVFVQCDCNIICPTEIVANASATAICSGAAVDLNFTITGGNSTMTTQWSGQDGNTINPENIVLQNNNCEPISYEFMVTAICDEDTSIILMDTIEVTVFTNDISPFISVVEEPCNIELNIVAECADFLTVMGEIPVINPGDSGVVSLNVISNDPLQCANENYELSYNCPACSISNLSAIVSECVDSNFMVELNLDIELGSDSFSVTDQNSQDLGIFNYADLPVNIGPILGDSVTTYTLQILDLENGNCTNSVTVGPKDCLPKCGDFEMPNVFSPNDDGLNDVFTAVGKWEFTVLEFKIFNRWGELVHDSVEPWDGKYKDKPHPSDVFFYQIVVDTMCGIEKEEGDVTLLR